MPKMYITKYALSTGIIETTETKDIGGGYITDIGSYNCYKLGRDIFKTIEEAIANAEDRRIAKMKSLDKQIKKLSAMVFSA
jgi:hypothetical protein